jgi:hypothetical protein
VEGLVLVFNESVIQRKMGAGDNWIRINRGTFKTWTVYFRQEYSRKKIGNETIHDKKTDG